MPMTKAMLVMTAQTSLSGVQNCMMTNFLLTFICDAGKNIHKTLISKFLYGEIYK